MGDLDVTLGENVDLLVLDRNDVREQDVRPECLQAFELGNRPDAGPLLELLCFLDGRCHVKVGSDAVFVGQLLNRAE